MKHVFLLPMMLMLATGCLPTREGHPFGADDDGDGGQTTRDAANNGVLDAQNNGTADAANNGTDDVGNNATDDGGNNATPDLGPDACAPESDEMFCQRQSAECEMLAGLDNCGAQRTADCGACTDGEPCSDNVCGACVPESNPEFCTRNAAECGQVSALDNCRMQRTANCGGCAGNGVGCNLQNTCQEVDCRDGQDNDGAGGADCDDPACLGQQCSGNPNKTCQADGSC